jgi:hypothetical protein
MESIVDITYVQKVFLNVVHNLQRLYHFLIHHYLRDSQLGFFNGFFACFIFLFIQIFGDDIAEVLFSILVFANIG